MRIALIGQPNAGKSSVLTRLTGAKIVVSNYPGTSVELMQAEMKVAGHLFEVVDTPGIYSLALAQAEETISRKIAVAPDTDLIINVVDAANLGRNLALTLELIELDKPMLVLLNQIDRVRACGKAIEYHELARILGCPVFPFSAITGEGVVELTEYLHAGLTKGFVRPHPSREARLQVMFFLAGSTCDGDCAKCLKSEKEISCPEEAVWARHEKARLIADRVTRMPPESPSQWLSRAEQIVDQPWWGSLILLGIICAGFLALITFAGWTEEVVGTAFGPIQSMLADLIAKIIPPGYWNEVLSKGIPEGLLVPFALVMPAMLLVALLMSLLEDTGLLARYAVALERLGGLIGVSGQAVIPLALGFGCRVPAVVATRVLPGVGQRFIIITLLSIVIPCAATLGMISAVIVAFKASVGILALTMLAVFVILGRILKRIYAEETEFVYELPPLRLPLAANIWAKIRIRFGGFFAEVLPMLVLMSIAVRVIITSGILDKLHGLDSVTRSLFGIPAEAFVAVLITVVQRYLAPLVLLNLSLDSREATIAVAMIVLSLPCLPVSVMIVREAGMKALAQIMAMGLAVSFTVGALLNLLLPH
ncbi:MAG: ferrous iron transporter B [Syntrophomonadaceae bacterium]|nr:ferrous iron transporter B [Syntrophomonadaceae bacterium]